MPCASDFCVYFAYEERIRNLVSSASLQISFEGTLNVPMPNCGITIPLPSVTDGPCEYAAMILIQHIIVVKIFFMQICSIIHL